MTLKIRKMSYAIGAEVIGLDFSKPIDDAVSNELRSAFLEHCVLVFRGQSITREQHIAFTGLFGEVDQNKVIPRPGSSGYSEISFVINKPKPNGEAIASHYQGEAWHFDHSYTPIPSKAVVLRAVELPEVGGDTMFANCYLAYESLSDGMKKLIEGLHGVHIRADYQNVLLDSSTSEKLAEAHRATRSVQPLVRVHPETGRKVLSLGKNLIKHIVGMTPEESAPLLDFLHKHATRPQLVYRHVWKKDDLVIWDNRATLHIALGDFDRKNQTRLLEKTSVLGTPSGYTYEGPVA